MSAMAIMLLKFIDSSKENDFVGFCFVEKVNKLRTEKVCRRKA